MAEEQTTTPDADDIRRFLEVFEDLDRFHTGTMRSFSPAEAEASPDPQAIKVLTWLKTLAQ